MFVLHRRILVDSVEIRLSIDAGSYLKMLGGWFECLCMYNGPSLGFVSRKFTTCKFASAVIFRPNCSKTLWSFFRVLSAKRADLFLIIAKPSSLYKVMFFLPNFFPTWFKMKRPTSSQSYINRWKMSRVTPPYKSGHRNTPENYRLKFGMYLV